MFSPKGFSNLDFSASGNSSAFKTSKENLNINAIKMEIGLRAFVQIADTIQQQKEANTAQPPQMPLTFNTPTNSTEPISIYLHTPSYLSHQAQIKSTRTSSLSNQLQNSLLTCIKDDKTGNKQRIMLNDALTRELGIGNYFEHVRRIFQDILKTLDASIGRTFLMTRPENTSLNSANPLETFNSKQVPGVVPGSVGSVANASNQSSAIPGD